MNKDKLLQIRITAAEYEALKIIAKNEGLTVSCFIRNLIEAYIMNKWGDKNNG